MAVTRLAASVAASVDVLVVKVDLAGLCGRALPLIGVLRRVLLANRELVAACAQELHPPKVTSIELERDGVVRRLQP